METNPEFSSEEIAASGEKEKRLIWASKDPFHARIYLSGMEVPSQVAEIIKQRMTDQFQGLKSEASHDVHIAGRMGQFQKELTSEPYMEPYVIDLASPANNIDAPGRSGKFVVGVATNMSSNLYLDEPSSFPSFQEAQAAAESLAKFIQSGGQTNENGEWNSATPSYNPESNEWYYPQLEQGQEIGN